MAETRKLGRPSFSPTRKEAFRKDSNMSKKMFRDKKRKERDEALSTVVPPTAPRYKHIRISTATFWRWRSLAQELGLEGDEQMASFLLNTYYERAVEAASKEQRQDIPQNSEESRQNVETSMFQGDEQGTETDAMGSTTLPMQATQDGWRGDDGDKSHKTNDGGEMLEGEFTCLVKTEPHDSGEESNEHGTLPSVSQQGDSLTGDDDDRKEIEEVEFKCLIKEEPDDGERNQPSCSKQGGNVGKQSSCQQKGNTQIISGDSSHDRSHGKHLPGDYPLQGTPSNSSPRGNCSSEYGSYLLPNQADYPQGQCSADSATTSNHDGERLVLDIVVGNEKYHTNSLQNTKKSSPVTAMRSIQGNPGIDLKEESTFLCSVCNEGCKRKDDLKRHMIFHKGKKPHECSFCNKTFVQKADLIRHERSHTGERPYSCLICNKRFTDTSHLKAHLSIHTGEKPYECSLCNKAFSNKANLTVHLRLHSGEKPFKCSLCNNSFSSKSLLVNHQIKHTGIKPYQCSICEKRLGKKYSLNQHMKIHSGEKPFQCSVCSKNFRVKSTLKKHMKIHEISIEDL